MRVTNCISLHFENKGFLKGKVNPRKEVITITVLSLSSERVKNSDLLTFLW